MRRHAKASTAGSNEGTGNSRGLFRRASARSLAFLTLATALVLTAFAPAASAAVKATPTYVAAGGIKLTHLTEITPGTPKSEERQKKEHEEEAEEASPGSLEGQYFTPTRLGLAVESATGNILVAEPAISKIQVFAPSQVAMPSPEPPQKPASVPIASIDTSPGVPNGIAMDQSNGYVYVSEIGSNKIARYISDGAPTPTYTLDPTFSSPAQGSAAGEIGSFNSALAVDPATHDLLVADAGNNRVSRYSSTGAFIGSFDGSDTAGGAFTGLLSVAVGSTGTLYVADESGNIVYGGSSRLERFSPAGVSQGPLDTLDIPRSVAIDPSGGNVLVGGRSGYPNPPLLYMFAGGTTPVSETDFPQNESQAVSLAVASGTHRLYGLVDCDFGAAGPICYNGVSALQAFDLSAIPGVDIGPPSEVTQTAAHLSGKVDPGGAATSAHFEYRFEGSTSWVSTPSQDLGEGSGEFPVVADLTALRPNAKYFVRLYVANSHFNSTSTTETFTTPVAPPTISDESASDIAQTSATLHGKILPNGLQTTYYFEYGLTTEYGARVPIDQDGVVGLGHQNMAVSHQITELQPGTDYHFRLVALNSAGTTAGEDATLTTEGEGVPTRGYEMVSPIEKNGVPADSHQTGARVSEDGNTIVFGTEKSSYPGTATNPYIPRAFGLRSATNWESGPLALPFDNHFAGFNLFYSTVAVSKDVSHALLVSTAKLTPDGIDGEFNLYLKDLFTGSYTLLASDPALIELTGSNGNYTQIGASDDLHTLAFIGGISGQPMYEATLGRGLQVVSVLPNGEPAGPPGIRNDLHEPNQVSADGSRIFFYNQEGVFMRENGEQTTRISPGAGAFITASPDGRYVVFDEGGSSYRYDVETEALTVLVGGGVSTTIAAQPENGIAYFAAGGNDNPSLYYAHEGTVTFIATAFDTINPNVNGPFGSPNEFTMSPNGRYFAFQSITNLTSFDSGNREEVFLYDSQTETLTCPSCRMDGGRATGDANLGTPENGGSSFNRWAARSVLDDGTVLFDTPDPLVAADANGTRDVYSSKDGRIRLISRGKLPTESSFVEATPDGSSIFFVTNDRLVGQDRDDVPDLYVSRLGGGLASQNPPPPIECLRDDCKATPNAGPELPFGGSEGLTGPGNVAAPVRKRCGKGRHKVKTRGKTRCVKQQKKRANSNRRQAR